MARGRERRQRQDVEARLVDHGRAAHREIARRKNHRTLITQPMSPSLRLAAIAITLVVLPAAQPSPRAVDVRQTLQRAIDFMGGEAALRAIRTRRTLSVDIGF